MQYRNSPIINKNIGKSYMQKSFNQINDLQNYVVNRNTGQGNKNYIKIADQIRHTNNFNDDQPVLKKAFTFNPKSNQS